MYKCILLLIECSQKVCEILHLKYRGALVKQRGIEKEVEIVG